MDLSRELRHEVGNKLSRTCCGVRTPGARVNTVATVAMRFLLDFCPLVRRSAGRAATGLTTGMPLQSTAATSREPLAGSGGRWNSQ